MTFDGVLPGSIPSDVPEKFSLSRKEDMLSLLMQTCSKEEIAWITAKAMKRDCPTISPPSEASLVTVQSAPTTKVVYMDLPQPELARQASNPMEGPPIVQFSTFMYFCTEDEPHMSADIIRIGNVSGISEVEFFTEDGTATAGNRYQKTFGKLVFQPNETVKEVKVPILQNAGWDTTLEFVIKLSEPKGCALGRYLYKTRVKVIDTCTFPTDKYKDEMAQDLTAVSKPRLLIEYFKMNFENPVVRKGTIRMVLVDVLHNIYFLLKLLMNIYLVDFILKSSRGDSAFPEDDLFLIKNRSASLCAFVALIMLPFALLHFLDYKRLSWKVGGSSRAKLQKSLLRKFLNYDEDSRSRLKQGDLVMAMTRDSVDLVHSGYMQTISIVKSIGQLLMILVFNLIVPPIFGKKFKLDVFLPLLLFPPFLVAFLFFRSKSTTAALNNRNAKQDALIDHVDQTVSNYRLIADYNKRPAFVGKYEALIGQFNGCAVAAGKILKNNAMFTPWLTTIFVCAYTVIGGLNYITALDGDEPPSLGVFLTNLSVIGTIGTSYGSIYSILLEMQSSFPALLAITNFMNLPTDVPQRMALNRARRAMTNELRDKLRQELKDEDGLPIDNLPIMLANPSFSYSRGTGDAGEEISMNRQGKLEIKQGQLVSLVGKRGEGKSTLLKILGGVVLPKPAESEDDGVFFLPSHLRVLHVSVETMFFYGTLMENMLFGTSVTDPDARISRVLSIAKKLGIGDNVLEYLSSKPEHSLFTPKGTLLTIEQSASTSKPDQKHAWNAVLSQTEKHLLCLARALIANPEVLCIHKPTLAFDEKTSNIVLEVLQEYVTDKGIDQDMETQHLRRPRTCIITSAKALGVSSSDRVFHVSKKNGICEVDKDDVKADMLG